MYTIGQVARKFSISRSTLIYYDKIKVLSPNARSESNYRLYSDDDLLKMEKISLYREAGLSLEAITEMLDQEGVELNEILEKRLTSINHEIQTLRNQQKVIVQLLKTEHAIKSSRIIDKKVWVSLLSAAGLDEDGMNKWHVEFECTSPEAHQDFLESIGIEKNEIASIREWAHAGKPDVRS